MSETLEERINRHASDGSTFVAYAGDVLELLGARDTTIASLRTELEQAKAREFNLRESLKINNELSDLRLEELSDLKERLAEAEGIISDAMKYLQYGTTGVYARAKKWMEAGK